jgi:cytochrome b6-f complex iron-sulfur subunit/menaquinol-cytochrome c reductase iron-sulfur subunit
MLGGAALGCAVAAPAAVFVVAPVRRGGGATERWVRTLPLDQLREGEPKKVSIVADQRDAWTLAKDVDLGAVWLVRRGDAVSAFSAVCPHLGCSVNALTDGTFACPCHTSAFAADGARMAGPAPRGMDPLAVRVDDGVVSVDFRRFRIGTEEREPIG